MLTCLHDYTSPASAVAVLRLQALADEGLAVGFEGFDARGVDAPLPVTLDVLDELRTVGQVARAHGLELRRPSRLPPTARAHVVGAWAASVDLGAAWRSAAYRALWEDDRDLADVDVLVAIGGGVGLAPDAVRSVATDRERIRRFRRAVLQRRRTGVGGVPVIDAGGTLIPATTSVDTLRDLAVTLAPDP